MADTLLTRNREEDSKRGDSAEVLILILDANPLSWSESLNIKHSMEQILVFLNSFLLLHHSNRLAVIANHPTKAEIIYPSPPSLIDNQNAAIKAMSKSKRDETSVKVPKADKKRAREVLSLLRNPTSRISSKLKEISRIPLPRATPRRSRLSGSMSIALCYIRRCVAEAASKGRTVEPRILVIDTAGCVGGGGEYVPIMNAIFSARKMGIQIDSLCLSKSKDQHFLQQASDITGGIYQKLGDISSLLQTLIMVYLPGKASRKELLMPKAQEVDYQASCFCHNKPVDTGYVCPVCLAIFCKVQPICTMCKTRYPYVIPGQKRQRTV